MLNRLFKKENKVEGLKWTCYPGRIGYVDDIQKEVKELNKEYKRRKMDQVRKAKMQYLQYGLGQLVFWSATW